MTRHVRHAVSTWMVYSLQDRRAASDARSLHLLIKLQEGAADSHTRNRESATRILTRAVRSHLRSHSGSSVRHCLGLWRQSSADAAKEEIWTQYKIDMDRSACRVFASAVHRNVWVKAESIVAVWARKVHVRRRDISDAETARFHCFFDFAALLFSE